jgi:AcrR family transcriptional regulator
MSKAEAKLDWRESRRQSARAAILEAAWAAVREEGLAALSLRDLARRAGITTPTVYAYFDSKHSIYDAMFGQAAADFDRTMGEPYAVTAPPDVLRASLQRFIDFCTADLARYQLLFQRTIPGFQPSPESYEPAVRALAHARQALALNGARRDRHVDMWTALTIGLVDQQIANDPGGDRWTRLSDDLVAMFLTYCKPLRRKDNK